MVSICIYFETLCVLLYYNNGYAVTWLNHQHCLIYLDRCVVSRLLRLFCYTIITITLLPCSIINIVLYTSIGASCVSSTTVVLLYYNNDYAVTLLNHQHCLIYLNRCVVCLVYYGLSLSSATLAGNLYVNFALSGAVEVPSSIMCAVLLKRYVCVTSLLNSAQMAYDTN